MLLFQLPPNVDPRTTEQRVRFHRTLNAFGRLRLMSRRTNAWQNWLRALRP